jgi:hypothetical protein
METTRGFKRRRWSTCTWRRCTVTGINQENERRGPWWVRSYDVKLRIKRTVMAWRQIRRIEPGGGALRFWVLGMELVAARGFKMERRSSGTCLKWPKGARGKGKWRLGGGFDVGDFGKGGSHRLEVGDDDDVSPTHGTLQTARGRAGSAQQRDRGRRALGVWASASAGLRCYLGLQRWSGPARGEGGSRPAGWLGQKPRGEGKPFLFYFFQFFETIFKGVLNSSFEFWNKPLNTKTQM